MCGGHQPNPDVPACEDQIPGQVCAEAGAACDLGDDCNVHLLCTDEDPRMGPCPRSSRAIKQDIRYLSKSERDRLARELLATRLATWRYRGPTQGDTHLGFVIEDGAPSPALRASQDQVDLYGYASLAVAALQMQEEELSQLRKEVAELREVVEALVPKPSEPSHP